LDLTFTQQQIYFDQARNADSPLYNVGGYIQFRAIDLRRLRDAHRRLIEGFGIFGLRIDAQEGAIGQRLDGDPDPYLEFIDFSGAEDPAGSADSWLREVFESPILVENSKLYRAFVLGLSKDEFRYVGLAHHIMMDGFGFSNWAKFICRAYENPDHAGDDGFSLAELVLDERNYQHGHRFAKDREFWADQLKDVSVAPLYPKHRHSLGPREASRSERLSIGMTRAELAALEDIARSLGVGVSHMVLAVLAIQFGSAVSVSNPVVGVPFHGRRGERQRNSLGVFVSMVPLVVDLSDRSVVLSDLIRDIAARQSRAMRHGRYPLMNMVKDTGGLATRHPFFDVGFSHLKLGSGYLVGGHTADLVYLGHNHEPLPVMVTLCEYGDHGDVELRLDHNLSFLASVEAERLLLRIMHLLRTTGRQLGEPLGNLRCLPEDEEQDLMAGFGDSDLPASDAAYAHHFFEARAKMVPDAIAVDCNGRVLTYRELDGLADRMAAFIRRNLPGHSGLIGLSARRSEFMIAAILGIMKAGAAYVPLDPDYPDQRLTDILEDSEVPAVLADADLFQRFEGKGVRLLAIEDAANHSHPDELGRKSPQSPDFAGTAYVIYTSGSTGKPKGVQISHLNVVEFLRWSLGVFSGSELKRVLVSTSINFDLSIFEMFCPLSAGGCCVVVDSVLTLLERKPLAISLINTVPSAMRTLIDQDAVPQGVETINLAGEALPRSIVNDLLENNSCSRVLNLYGPSEDTTYSSYAIFDKPLTGQPHIGRAIAGTRFFILDQETNLVPQGAVGELHIAGRGLAMGYLNNPELTRQKFGEVVNPLLRGIRLYKTGDLVRYDSDGRLEYVGRNDDQVKIRGYRIEPGEVRQCLESGPGVERAAVTVREIRGDKVLAAYVVRSSKPGSVAESTSNETWLGQLRTHMGTSLPKYMVPSFLTVVDKLPLTANGKVDKKTLLEFELPEIAAVCGPTSATEHLLVGLVATQLGRDPAQIDVTANLIEIGAHSLMLVALANQVNTTWGLSMPLSVYFGASDIRHLAQGIDERIAFESIGRLVENAEVLSSGYL